MKISLAVICVLALCISLVTTAAVASDITGVTIAGVSSSWYTMPAENIINGNGLDTSTSPATHSNSPAEAYHWETMPYQSSAYIIFDLGAQYSVGGFHVWNFNFVNSNGSYTGRGAKDVDISTSDGSAWTNRGSYVFDIATGTSDYAGQQFDVTSWENVRQVKFDIRNYYGYGDAAGHIGLSEVRFQSTPEPSSLLALASSAIGLAGALRRRRKA